MEKINGIILNGKIYVAVKFKAHEHCGYHDCSFYIHFGCSAPKLLCRVFEGDSTNKYIFRHSPSLTERLKGGEKSPKSKRMCLRDKSKVCDLCHECDIDPDLWYNHSR